MGQGLTMGLLKPVWRQEKTLGQSSRTSVRYWLSIGAATLKNGPRTRGITSQTPMTHTEQDWSSN